MEEIKTNLENLEEADMIFIKKAFEIADEIALNRSIERAYHHRMYGDDPILEKMTREYYSSLIYSEINDLIDSYILYFFML